jgi:hypothetical protein
MHTAQGRLFRRATVPKHRSSYPSKDKILPFKHSPTSHLPYCNPSASKHPVEKDGVCMQHRRAKKDQRKKKQHSVGASMPTSRIKHQAPVKEHACGEFDPNSRGSTGAPRTSQPPPFPVPTLLFFCSVAEAALSTPPAA